MNTDIAEPDAGPRIIPALMGLRGCGAVWVMLFHLQPDGFGLARLGCLWVPVLPAERDRAHPHLLARLRSEARRKPRGYGEPGGLRGAVTGVGVWRFLLLRLVRVYPLHAVMLGAMGGALLLAPEWFREQADAARVFSAGAFAANLFLVQNWVPRFAVTWKFLLLLLPVPYLSFRFIEVPSRRWGRRLARRLERRCVLPRAACPVTPPPGRAGPSPARPAPPSRRA